MKIPAYFRSRRKHTDLAACRAELERYRKAKLLVGGDGMPLLLIDEKAGAWQPIWPLIEESKRLRQERNAMKAFAKNVINLGHNEDCIFCGLKDKALRAMLGAMPEGEDGG